MSCIGLSICVSESLLMAVFLKEKDSHLYLEQNRYAHLSLSTFILTLIFNVLRYTFSSYSAICYTCLHHH